MNSFKADRVEQEGTNLKESRALTWAVTLVAPLDYFRGRVCQYEDFGPFFVFSDIDAAQQNKPAFSFAHLNRCTLVRIVLQRLEQGAKC